MCTPPTIDEAGRGAQDVDEELGLADRDRRRLAPAGEGRARRRERRRRRSRRPSSRRRRRRACVRAALGPPDDRRDRGRPLRAQRVAQRLEERRGRAARRRRRSSRRRRGRRSRPCRRRRRSGAAAACRSRALRRPASTTAFSTQPPLTEPAMRAVRGHAPSCRRRVRGAEPQVSTTVASATGAPSARQRSMSARMSRMEESLRPLRDDATD